MSDRGATPRLKDTDFTLRRGTGAALAPATHSNTDLAQQGGPLAVGPCILRKKNNSHLFKCHSQEDVLTDRTPTATGDHTHQPIAEDTTKKYFYLPL